jgi:hypothetical protein
MIRWVDRLLDRSTTDDGDDTKKIIESLHCYIICIFTTRLRQFFRTVAMVSPPSLAPQLFLPLIFPISSLALLAKHSLDFLPGSTLPLLPTGLRIFTVSHLLVSQQLSEAPTFLATSSHFTWELDS